ncbi:hypothetical protein F5887DRAFT_1206408 [Amanita rubescens]|nr:hypothetical protein F5887DRAFT_1206408 [Amanita rubescens]
MKVDEMTLWLGWMGGKCPRKAHTSQFDAENGTKHVLPPLSIPSSSFCNSKSKAERFLDSKVIFAKGTPSNDDRGAPDIGRDFLEKDNARTFKFLRILLRSRLARATGREEKASKFCVMRERGDVRASSGADLEDTGTHIVRWRPWVEEIERTPGPGPTLCTRKRRSRGGHAYSPRPHPNPSNVLDVSPEPVNDPTVLQQSQSMAITHVSWSRLPLDIVPEIFVYLSSPLRVHRLYEFPWYLGHICSQWRAVLFSMWPSFCNEIEIKSWQYHNGDRDFVRVMRILGFFLDAVRGAPFSFTFHMVENPGKGRSFAPDILWKLSKHSDQWENVSMRLQESEFILLHKLKDAGIILLPSLTYLSLQGATLLTVLETPVLKSLEISFQYNYVTDLALEETRSTISFILRSKCPLSTFSAKKMESIPLIMVLSYMPDIEDLYLHDILHFSRLFEWLAGAEPSGVAFKPRELQLQCLNELTLFPSKFDRADLASLEDMISRRTMKVLHIKTLNTVLVDRESNKLESLCRDKGILFVNNK